MDRTGRDRTDRAVFEKVLTLSIAQKVLVGIVNWVRYATSVVHLNLFSTAFRPIFACWSIE